VVEVDASGQGGEFSNFIEFEGVTIDPDLKTTPIKLQQVGPGRYQTEFPVSQQGTYVVNPQYRQGGKTGFVRGAVCVPFAPEFRDLKDNLPLLRDVATITGGRVLSGDPDADKVFDHAGLAFPVWRKPLWRELGLLWLALFLLDVATRRVVVDFVGLVRRAGTWARGLLSPPTKEQKTLTALQEQRQKVKQKLRRKPATEQAQRRYEAPAQPPPGGVELPEVGRPSPPKPAPVKPEEKKPAPPAGGTFLDRLKDAKRKARDDMKDKDE